MQRKHKMCRWKSEKIRSRNSLILIEGYYWLVNVYFNSKTKLIDADIEFFKERIKQYENLLKLESKNLFNEDMKIQELVNYFNKKYETIEKAIWKMIKVHSNFRYIDNNEYIITKEGIEELKNSLYKEIIGLNPAENEFLTNQRHQSCLKLALEALNNALEGAKQQELQDLISIDLKAALTNLGEISGEVITDDILNNIFENFCIGK